MGKTIILLGIPVEDLTMAEALERCEQYIHEGRATGRPHYITTANADFAVISLTDPELGRILLESDMTTADGMPLVWAARLLGLPIEGRVTGSDLVPALAELAARKGFSIFMLGAGPGVAARAASILQHRHPGLKIVGTYSPPPASLLEMDPSVLELVRNAKPDLLLVALGTPKQEKWIKMHLLHLGVPLSIGVGATFDFIAGVQKRAPQWMQRVGLEWFYRLVNDPRRLWKRYVVDLFYFSVFFVRQFWEMRIKGSPTQPQIASDEHAEHEVEAVPVMRISGRLDVSNMDVVAERMRQLIATQPFLILDLAETNFVDSSALGMLVTFTRQARNAGGQLWLARVPAPILQIIKLMRLENFFEIQERVEDAIEARYREASPLPAPEPTPIGWSIIKMPRIVDATVTPALAEHCLASIEEHPWLVLDFSETVFMSSAGLAMIVKLQSTAQQQQGGVHVAACQRDVRRTIEMVRLDQLVTLHDSVEQALRTIAPVVPPAPTTGGLSISDHP